MQKELETIKQAVEEAKDYPNAVIEYSLELPLVKGITADSFFGVKAKYNPKVQKVTGLMITYKMM